MSSEGDLEKGAAHDQEEHHSGLAGHLAHPHLPTHLPHPHTPAIIKRAGRRIQLFYRPNGRKVYVVQDPEEEERLRKQSSSTEPNQGFDIVIQASPDHIKALRETTTHYEDIREKLKLQYGADFERFEQIVKNLDSLSTELHMVSAHAVQLDAQFERFGYSANIRTLPPSGTASSASSLHGGHDNDHDHDEEHESQKDYYQGKRKQGETMYFFKRPVMRQYFHKGLLWRSSELQEVQSYELFVDLFYVGIIAIAGDAAAEDPTGQSLWKFSVVFILSYKFWSDVSVYVSWFDAEDVFRRLLIMFVLTCLLGLTVNIANSWETTWTALISFYMATRWLGSLYYLWMSYLLPMVRNSLIGNAVICFIPGILYIGSTFVENNARQALVWPAMALDIFGPPIFVSIQRGPEWLPKKIRAWAKKTFDAMPGANIEHKIERTNAFVGLVFGYSVVSLFYQSSVKMPLNAFFGKAVLFLIIAFTYNWIYFEIDTFNLHTHAIRRHFWSSLLWLSAHLPFVMAFVLAGASLSKIVLAHDTDNAEPEWLTETYAARSEGEIEIGLRWFYCAGLSISMMSMTIISMCHTYRTIPDIRLRKGFRILYRFSVSIALLLLPLAKDSLNSLQLVATTCGLVFSVLLLEIRGSAKSKSAFFGIREFRRKKRRADYTAKCHVTRKMLENMKKGKRIDVEELAKKEKSDENAREGIMM